jgi:hypothetical protein
MQTINNNLIKAAITAHNHIQACDLEAQERHIHGSSSRQKNSTVFQNMALL